MNHLYVAGRSHQTIILLHGTGGDEHDLVPLAQTILPGASILSLRGNINENGMHRFFRRHAPGVLDEASVMEQTHVVMAFLKECETTYSFSLKDAVALGYSNGANLLASVLFHYGDVFSGVLLHHPMMPLANPAVIPQTSRVWIGAGTHDSMVPSDQTKRLESILQQAGAAVITEWFAFGHQLTQAEVHAAKDAVNQWEAS
jgi:phospholipase/carboxylesterase